MLNKLFLPPSMVEIQSSPPIEEIVLIRDDVADQDEAADIALDEPQRLESIKKQARKQNKPFFAISSVANHGVKELVAFVADQLKEKI